MIFDWVDFYQELADKLLQFKNDRKPLVQILKTINESMGFYDIFIWNGIKFEDVCPFTTFALFNRGMKKENRIKICSMLKEKLGINANLPTDFLGIPIVNSQKVRFYEHDKKQNIDNLWNIFEKAIDYSRNHNITTKNEICSLFDIVESQKLVKWNLTMGLFWVRPYDYINLDQNNRVFIKKHMGEEVNNVPSGIEYFELIDRVNRFISTRDDIKNFIELSHKAWQEGEEENKKSNDNIQRVWIYAPGQNASLWDEFYKDGIMALGWDELGNLKDYNSKEDIQKRLQEMSDNTSSKKNDALANWEFANVMKKGDIVYAKKGNSLIIGKGIVKSDYLFDDTANYFKSYREVDWISNDVKDHVGLLGNTIVLKTLTDITKYEEYVKKFEEMYSNSKASVKEESENYMANNYYWLNANPKIWSFSELSVGETIDYTATNENGNKRRIYKNFVEAKMGDRVICYESYPTKKIVGLGVVNRDLFIDDDGVEVLMIKK